jgi:gas vesicle protein
MRQHHLHTKEFIIGAAVGSLLGSVTALLIAPKAGRKLRGDICDAYSCLTDKTQDLASKGKSLAKSIGCQTCGWANKAKCAVDNARKTIKSWTSEEEEETTQDLLIGGLVGGIVGAAVGLLLAPKSGEELRRDFRDTCEDLSERTQDFADDMTRRGKSFARATSSKANKWLVLAQDIIEDLTEGSQGKGGEWIEQVKGFVKNKRVNEAMDWAQLGYRLWRGIQSRR